MEMHSEGYQERHNNKVRNYHIGDKISRNTPRGTKTAFFYTLAIRSHGGPGCMIVLYNSEDGDKA